MRLFALLVCLTALALPGEASAQSKELLLFNWSNYTPPALLKRFEAETGIKVTLDTYDTNEAMLAKLQAGGGGYDVVVPTGPTLQAMIREGLGPNDGVVAPIIAIAAHPQRQAGGDHRARDARRELLHARE